MEEQMKKAAPIFLSGLENTLNVQAGFRHDVVLGQPPEKAILRITARSYYRLYINGEVCMHGPARTAHGYLRVDELDVAAWLWKGKNCIAVETVAGVGCLGGYSNDCTAESSLLMAELELDGKVVLATDAGWDALRLSERVEYTEKISHCRQNSEVYRLDEGYTRWRTQLPATAPKLPWVKAALCAGPRPQLLGRPMPLPTLEKHGGAQLVLTADAAFDRSIPYQPAWYEEQYGEYYSKIEEHVLQDYVQTREGPLKAKAECRRGGVAFTGVAGDETPCAFFDLGEPRLGFLGFTVRCSRAGVLDVAHLEGMNPTDDKHGAIGGANPMTRLYLPAGEWSFLTMEPMLARHLKFYFRGLGDCELLDIHVRGYCYPDRARTGFVCSDEDINRLYRAALRTLRYNTLDIFMDCPERERGGWLCDSLWTSRAAALMLGDLSVEKAFLENFLLAPYGDGVGSPNNFFPEVYPGSKLPGAPSITTWSFWLMLELAEYVERSGDLQLALQHEKRVADFVEGCARYEGPSGLLENMPNIFIDWSMSNDPAFNQPISTAANALYAFMLQRLAQLYRRADWQEAAGRVRSVLRGALLGDGGPDFLNKPFFPDALCRLPDGRLKKQDRYSEACQYTILWSELFDKAEIPAVADEVLHGMGPAPQRAPSTLLGRSGLFIGLCIRMDLLAKWHEPELLLRELRAVYLPQLSEGPGTLWEVQELNGTSRCHGFASHAGVHLLRDLLGLDIPRVFDLEARRLLTPDEQRTAMWKEPHLCGLRWMRGAVETPNGAVSREVRP